MNESDVCESCPKAGKYHCTECKASLCIAHIKEHKERLPDCPHRVVPKKGSQPVVNTIPDQSSEDRTPIVSRGRGTQAGSVQVSEEGVSDVSNIEKKQLPKKRRSKQSLPSQSPNFPNPSPPIDRKQSPVESILKKRKPRQSAQNPEEETNPPLPRDEGTHHRVHEEPLKEPKSSSVRKQNNGRGLKATAALELTQEIQTETSPRVIFEGHYDIAQNYKLHKWILNAEETEKLFQEISEMAEDVKVVGVYGSIRNCLQFIGNILQSEIGHQEDSREGILAYYRRDLGIVCFWFKVDDDAIYERKPYPKSAREAIYVRLLLDLCQTLVCCPSETVQFNWYFSNEPTLQNPFVPKVHRGMAVTMQSTQPRSTEIEEIEVRSSLDHEAINMTSDHFPYLFTSTITTKDTSQCKLALKRLNLWLENRRCDLKKLKDRDEHSVDFEEGAFITLSSTLRFELQNGQDVVVMVKERYTEMKRQLRKLTQDIVAKFIRAFRGTYQLKKEMSIWEGYSVGESFAEFEQEVLEALDEKRDVFSIRNLNQKCKNFILGFSGGAKNEEQAKKSGEKFIIDNVKVMTEKRENCIDQLIGELGNELENIIIARLSEMRVNLFAFRTCTITFEDEAVVINESEVENPYTLQENDWQTQFQVLEENVAFLYFFEVADSFQAIKFNPKPNARCDIESLPQLKIHVILASGSSSTLFVAFSNAEKRAYYGSAQEMKAIHNGISLEVYGDRVSEVISACILQKSKRLLLLNEEGKLFNMELSSRERQLKEVMVDNPERVKEPLRPATGTRFYAIQALDDLYFLLTETAIEIYDLNFKLKKQISVSSHSVQFKVMSEGLLNFVLVKSEVDGFKAYRFQSESQRMVANREESKQVEIPGNPVIDILYYAFSKFGKTNHFASAEPQSLYLYTTTQDKRKEMEKYITSITYLNGSLQYKGLILAGDMPQLRENIGPTNLEDLHWRVQTRAPLHLSSVQNGTLIPLQDGLNNFEMFISEMSERKVDFVTAFVEYIRLGSLEKLITEATDLKIVSVIGRQSSGKSYLMNRLFGTRFDVAAARCTDGIWMSLSKVENQTFLVLDCEGLFSPERSESEEVKLCLFLAAISDVLILRQDLHFDRYLGELFGKFTFAVDRLKGSKLFKGYLEIAFRDVGAHQDEGANSEAMKFEQSLTKGKFLMKLFGGKYVCNSYHNFETEDLFGKEIAITIQSYLHSVESQWKSGLDCLITLKTVLAQLFADDSTNIDPKIFQLKLKRVIDAVKEAFNNPSKMQNLVSPPNPAISVSLDICGRKYSFSMHLFDLTVDIKATYQVFDEFLAKYDRDDLRKFKHNDWYKAVEQFMKLYFAAYKETIIDYVTRTVSGPEESKSIYDEEMAILEQAFEKVLLLDHTLCMRKCKNCDLVCLYHQNHLEDCDCSTSHKCMYKCSICDLSEPCSQLAGHIGKHIGFTHSCGEQCQLRGCKGICNEAPKHHGQHKCSAQAHPCGEPCALFDMCGRYCEYDLLFPHDRHNCRQQNCPFPCSMEGCTSTCMSEDHLHNLSSSPEEIYSESGQVLHFCDKTHSCRANCEIDGVCNLENVTESQVWSNEYNSFSYPYVRQRAARQKCILQIPVKSLSHPEHHRCKAEEHKCYITCPDCGAYCELAFDHSGVHSSAAHRNKEKCIYIAKSEGIEYEVKEESKTTTRKLKAGEAAKPEFCDQSCARKGRGHIHPVECNGGSSCLEVVYAGRAMHSTEQFLPHLNQQYDLVECGTYWKHKKWEPPVSRKDPEAQDLYTMCPYYCASKEHTERVYCEGELFHSKSNAFKDHIFQSCMHRGATEFDIAFVLDCTGSMATHILQVNEVITRIIQDYESKGVSNKFAIVGYKDHYQNSGSFPADLPVQIYPLSKQLRAFNKDEALAFLKGLRADGGGEEYGEAMLDGINAAIELQWRPNASRICFIIGDDSPHGDIFHDGTAYPEGCPCGHDWRTLLQNMKENKTEVRLVKLSPELNKTAAAFSEEYGEGLEVIELEGMSNISLEVVSSIASVISYNLELAETSNL